VIRSCAPTAAPSRRWRAEAAHWSMASCPCVRERGLKGARVDRARRSTCLHVLPSTVRNLVEAVDARADGDGVERRRLSRGRAVEVQIALPARGRRSRECSRRRLAGGARLRAGASIPGPKTEYQTPTPTDRSATSTTTIHATPSATAVCGPSSVSEWQVGVGIASCRGALEARGGA